MLEKQVLGSLRNVTDDVAIIATKLNRLKKIAEAINETSLSSTLCQAMNVLEVSSLPSSVPIQFRDIF